jgi:L-fuconolactonase
LLISLDIDDAIFIAQQFPKLKIVINNIDSVISKGKDQNPESQNKIKMVTSFPNVYCKVTSLINVCTKTRTAKEMNYFKNELANVLELFGEDRIIYGSNWPCIIKNGEFSDHFKVINDYFAPKGRRVLEKLYYQNAEKVYGFKLK